MSLVNDALKRAQSAQRPILPVQRAEFRPVETPAPRAKFGLPVLLLVGVALFPIVAFLVVRMALHGDSSDIQANASAAHIAAPVQPSQPAPPPAAPPPAAAPPAAAPEPQNAPAVAESHTPAPAATQTPSVSPAASPTPTPAGGPSHTALPTEATPPPKLQSIVFAPNNPSAMINGRVAFVGDKLPEGKVVAISLKSVTLNAGSETIVLTLSE